MTENGSAFGFWWTAASGGQRLLVDSGFWWTAASGGQRLLVDSGADRTVFNAALTSKLNLAAQPAEDRIQGVAGECEYVTMRSALVFKRDDGVSVRVRGAFLGLLDPRATDLCILGRDVLDNFDVIHSRRRGEVLLLAPPHQYQVMTG